MADSHSTRGTHPSLLVRIRDSKDNESWAEFVEVYAPLIHGYCLKRGVQDCDAADIAQETLLQVSRSIRGFVYQPERGRFRDWLGAVTRSRIARHFRGRTETTLGGDESRDLREQLPDPAADGEWAAEFNARLLNVAIERVRNHFEEASWLAFEASWLKSKPAAEAATELGIPIESVYVAKSRVLKRLRLEVLVLAEDAPRLVPLH